MGKDADGCCEACKQFGDAPAAETVPAVPMIAAYARVKILVSKRGGEVTEVLPTKDRLYAGRVTGNDILLPNGSISKRQFMLQFSERGVVVVDMKSSCGTIVNDRKVMAPTIVPEGATIYAGDFAVRIVPR